MAAPVTWVLIAAGQDESSRTIDNWVKADSFNWANLIQPTVYLAAAAVLLGLIGTLRVSPLGAMAAGLVFVAPYAAMFVAPFRVHDAVPDHLGLFGDSAPLHRPLDNGTLFLLGAMLLMATFSAGRWRRWPAADAYPPPAGDDGNFTEWSSFGGPASDGPPPSLGYPSAGTLTEPLPRRESGPPWTSGPGTSAGWGGGAS